MEGIDFAARCMMGALALSILAVLSSAFSHGLASNLLFTAYGFAVASYIVVALVVVRNVAEEVANRVF